MFVEEIARAYNISLSADKKFFGISGSGFIAGNEVKLLIPTTFMNLSGKSVAALMNFYKITTEEMLVAHDELDFEPGIARIKLGGGHGGHNGLRDIISQNSNNKAFYRLRIGIGHPGHANEVANYVLKKAPSVEHEKTQAAIDEAIRHLPKMVAGEWQTAMNQLHSYNA
jgi:PTH1 family peptidyl-tRNA hydrolase